MHRNIQAVNENRRDKPYRSQHFRRFAGRGHRQHHNVPADKTQKPAHDAACLAACAAICSSITASDVSGIAYAAPVSGALKLVRASTMLSSLMGSPPFRPPRA